MPDIGGAGQQKLLETHVLICAPSMKTCDMLVNYLAAVGISTIYCFLENKDGWESGITHCRDLNPDVNIEWTDAINVTTDYNIIMGDFLFSADMSDRLIESTLNEISPTFISIIDAWQACISLCDTPKAIKTYLAAITRKHHLINEKRREPFVHQLGLTLSYAFIGPLLALELIKARLKIGVMLEDIFYFDLWNTSFDRAFSISNGSFHNFNDSSFRLKNSLDDFSVLIIGADAGLKGKLLYYDALETSFDIFQFQKNTDCPLCGDQPSINELGDSFFVCAG